MRIVGGTGDGGCWRHVLGMVCLLVWIGGGHGKPCYPAVYVFGDASADVGSMEAAFPRSTAAERSPYGHTYFKKPANRFSDGRLFVDLLVQAVGHPLLSPYLQAAGSNFSHGASFAASGSGVRDAAPHSPFSLTVQLQQFRAFKQRIREVRRMHSYEKAHLLPKLRSLRRSLFYISFMGDDYTNGYLSGMEIGKVQEYVPEVVRGIVNGIRALYHEGARHFIVSNMPPQGCLPSYLTLFHYTAHDLNSAGCLVNYNRVNELHNNLLKKAALSLRKQLKNATLIYMDAYAMMTNVLNDPSLYGFTHTTTACCGSSGGPYNYDPAVGCGSSSKHLKDDTSLTADSCPDPQHYVQWDGVHQTEAYNLYAIKAALSGDYFQPRHLLQHKCKLHLRL